MTDMETGTIDTLKNDAMVSLVEYAPTYSVPCSVGKRPFTGTAKISYRPTGRLLEFESFETWLASLADVPMTIEELTRCIFDKLKAVLEPTSLSVRVEATTSVHAPVAVVISEGI